VIGTSSWKFSSAYITTIYGALVGNASTATTAGKWTTTRTIALTGDVTGSTNIDGSGNISIATTNVGAVTGSGVTTRVAYWSATSALSSDSTFTYAAASDRLSVGNLSIGTALTSYALNVRGGIYLEASTGSVGIGVTPNATNGRIDASDDIVSFSSSDRKWKKNLVKIQNPIQNIMQINGYTFDWIDDPTHKFHGNTGSDVGVIAQEIEKVQPEIVTTRSKNGVMAVKYDRLIPLLIESIKEQQSQLDTQSKQITELQEQVKFLIKANYEN